MNPLPSNKTKFQRKPVQAPEAKKAFFEGKPIEYETIEDTHTQTGEKIFVVKVKTRVSDFNALSKKMRELGAKSYYRKKGDFIFYTDPTDKLSTLTDDSVSAVSQPETVENAPVSDAKSEQQASLTNLQAINAENPVESTSGNALVDSTNNTISHSNESLLEQSTNKAAQDFIDVFGDVDDTSKIEKANSDYIHSSDNYSIENYVRAYADAFADTMKKTNSTEYRFLNKKINGKSSVSEIISTYSLTGALPENVEDYVSDLPIFAQMIEDFAKILGASSKRNDNAKNQLNKSRPEIVSSAHSNKSADNEEKSLDKSVEYDIIEKEKPQRQSVAIEQSKQTVEAGETPETAKKPQKHSKSPNESDIIEDKIISAEKAAPIETKIENKNISQNIADFVKGQLAEGRSVTINGLFIVAAKEYGGTMADNVFTSKDA